MAFGIDNQRWQPQRQAEVQTNPLAAEAATLAANQPAKQLDVVKQLDVALGAMPPRLDAGKAPSHAESNYVLKNNDGELAGIDFSKAPPLYTSLFGESKSFDESAKRKADSWLQQASMT
jgi:hypothetical protein